MSANRWMDKQVPCNGIVFSNKNELLMQTPTWMNLKTITLKEAIPPKSTYFIIVFIPNSRKWKLLHSDRKQIGGCLRGRKRGRQHENGWSRKKRLKRTMRKVSEWQIRSLSWLRRWFYRCAHTSKGIKLYALNMSGIICQLYLNREVLDPSMTMLQWGSVLNSINSTY